MLALEDNAARHVVVAVAIHSLLHQIHHLTVRHHLQVVHLEVLVVEVLSVVVVLVVVAVVEYPLEEEDSPMCHVLMNIFIKSLNGKKI